jgi:hypothetical protein
MPFEAVLTELSKPEETILIIDLGLPIPAVQMQQIKREGKGAPRAIISQQRATFTAEDEAAVSPVRCRHITPSCCYSGKIRKALLDAHR